MKEGQTPSLRGAQDALLLIPYGVYVVTTGEESQGIGAFTASWVMQISFEPLLIAVAVDKTSHSHALLEENGLFALNILDQGQTQLAARLGTPFAISPYKFNSVAWYPGLTGVPLLEGALAHVECQTANILDPDGDHSMFIGQVVAGVVNRREPPLSLERSGLRYR